MAESASRTTTLAETRRIIRDLTPSAVDEAGLEGALRLLCARAEAEGAAARVRFRTADGHGTVFDGQAAATLFRVAQSALANVREHARAVNVQVTLRAGVDRVELEVRDDGAGFEPGRLTGPSSAGRGLGLPAARARLRECGGDLDIGSAPGRGTCVRATVPTAPSARPAPVAAR